MKLLCNNKSLEYLIHLRVTESLTVSCLVVLSRGQEARKEKNICGFYMYDFGCDINNAFHFLRDGGDAAGLAIKVLLWPEENPWGL